MNTRQRHWTVAGLLVAVTMAASACTAHSAGTRAVTHGNIAQDEIRVVASTLPEIVVVASRLPA